MAAVAAPLILLGVHFSSPGNPGNANGPEVKQDNSQPKKAPFKAADREAVHKVLREFVLTAVDRQNVGAPLASGIGIWFRNRRLARPY